MGFWAMGRFEGALEERAGTARAGSASRDLEIHVQREDFNTMKITGRVVCCDE